jgi:competence protein ComEC
MMALALCIALVSLRPRNNPPSAVRGTAFRKYAIVSALLFLIVADWEVIRGKKPDLSPGKLEITAIDVAQGDSLFVVTPEGKTLLVDGGGILGNASNFDIGEDVVSTYLWARGVSHLDAVALSHPHADHIGGLPAVLRNFHPAQLWVAPSPPNAAYAALISQARTSEISVHLLAAGDSLQFGSAKVQVLAPLTRINFSERRGNDDSLILKISYGSTSVLLEGDAERRTERLIIPELGAVNLLKVAHHGSSTSSIPQIIDSLRPHYAVISVGKFNRYGHPRPEVVERLSESGACTFRTDLEGALSFYLDGTEVTSLRWGKLRQAIEFPSRWIPPREPGHCAAAR